MTQGLLKTVIFFCNYSSMLYYSCTRRSTVLCSMKNVNTITVAHLIAWRTSQIKRIRKRSTTFFRCVKVIITIWMLKSVSGRKGICSRPAWTALHVYGLSLGVLCIAGKSISVPVRLALISIHRSCTVHSLWVIHSWLTVSHYKWKTKAQK